MLPNKKYLMAFLVLLALFSMLLALALKKSPEKPITTENIAPISQFKTLTPSPTVFDQNFTSLGFNPASKILKIGQEENINLVIDTGINTVVGAELTLAYNPNIIDVVSVVPGGFFTSPDVLLNKLDNEQGTINYALGSREPKMGNGNFLTLSVRGKSSGQTEITFSQKPKIAGTSEGTNNILKTAEGVKITVE